LSTLSHFYSVSTMYWGKSMKKNYGKRCLGWPLNRIFLFCSSGRRQCRKACLPQQSIRQHVQYCVSSIVMNGEGCRTWISVAYFTACSTKTDFHDVRNLYSSHKTGASSVLLCTPCYQHYKDVKQKTLQRRISSQLNSNWNNEVRTQIR